MKYLSILLLCLFLGVSTSAQVIQNYGFKVGYVSSTYTYSGLDLNNSTKWKSGYSFSAFVDIFNINGFSISPEIKYIQKGAGLEFIYTGPDSPEPIGIKTDFVYHNYLSIPISLVYKFQLNAGIPFIKLAPRYDILLNSYDDSNLPASAYDNYKNVFGGTISAGFIPNLQMVVNPFIEISYHTDFTSMFSIPLMKIKNNVVEINLGVQF